MGSQCVECLEKSDLTFHHPKGRRWEPRLLNQEQRMRHYLRDFEAGVLVLLCYSCNSRDGAIKKEEYRKIKAEI
jgi:hypothetical protein